MRLPDTVPELCNLRKMGQIFTLTWRVLQSQSHYFMADDMQKVKFDF